MVSERHTNISTRIVAVILMIAGVLLVVVSGYLIQQTKRIENHPMTQTARNLLEKVNMYFGENHYRTYSYYDYTLDEIFRLLVGCGIAGLFIGAIQFIIAVVILILSAKGRATPVIVGIWIVVQIVMMVALIGIIIRIVSNQTEIPNVLPVFIACCATVAMLILVSVVVQVMLMMRQQKNSRG